MMFKTIKKAGVLGMNRRIGQFILRLNPRANFPLVDDKVLSHELGMKHNIPMPAIHAVIDRYGDLKKLKQILDKDATCAIKPARGAMGNGVLLVHEQLHTDDSTTVYATSQGDKDEAALQYHISCILSGLYSLNGLNDRAIIQEKINVHPLLKEICASGIPDIRVIICKGVPVMGMIRLPTLASRGRANLHQGAVGCGLDMKTGTITNAIHQNKIIKEHPDTHFTLHHLKLPYWEELLEIASRCYDMTDLGYIGIDIVLDPIKGPLLLEMNARPGLSIQIANLSGLVPRLEKVLSLKQDLSWEDRVEFCLNNF